MPPMYNNRILLGRSTCHRQESKIRYKHYIHLHFVDTASDQTIQTDRKSELVNDAKKERYTCAFDETNVRNGGRRGRGTYQISTCFRPIWTCRPSTPRTASRCLCGKRRRRGRRPTSIGDCRTCSDTAYLSTHPRSTVIDAITVPRTSTTFRMAPCIIWNITISIPTTTGIHDTIRIY